MYSSNAQNIAIPGASDTTGRPVDRAGCYLLEQACTVRPVHPARRTVWGLAASRSRLSARPGGHC
ncbi:CoA-binding protein [uncultured Desulfovibrio sp.]|uniref:CoA-binding protein n=1 Tax=uncultured Desulfovibrio sp. TaxID=167968 RepID=UPI00345C3BE1